MLLRPIPRPNIKAPKTFEPRAWTDADDTALAEHFNSRGFPRVGRNLVRDVIELEAKSHPFHPVREYLEGSDMGWHAAPLALPARVLRRSRRRARTRGAQRRERCTCRPSRARSSSRRSPASSSPAARPTACRSSKVQQGALKSQLLRTLAVRDEWFSDSLPHDLTSKDARAHLAGKWIVEMGEIAQFRRSEIETVKSFLSCQEDKYRPPYGRSEVSVPRQTIFVGTHQRNNLFARPDRQPALLAGPCRLDQAQQDRADRGPALGRSRRGVPRRGKVVALGEARAAGGA